ncbi:MAG: cytidylyltransferase domain-containing protein [Magnetovibrionaceae bacterium]
MTVTAFIFARGGSKGVPGKNIRPLAGRSLIARAVDCAKGVPAIKRVVLSTDDPALAEEGERAGAEVPFLRPAELAADDAPEWLAWRHALQACPDTSLFVSVPPTAPLRAPQDVSACLDRYAEGDVDVVITAMPAKRHPAFNMVRLDDAGLAGLAQPMEKIIRRQDAPALFDMTTVCYVADPGFVKLKMGLFEGRVGMVEVPEERALDIDTPLDWQIAEALIVAKEDAA